MSPEGRNVLWRDVLTATLVIFMGMVMILFPLIANQKAQEDTKPPGTLQIELRWPDDVNVDVDLWLRSPQDAAVGYSRKGGQVLDLLRDDLGFDNDALGLNYENAYSRGLPPGRYVVNAHWYGDKDGTQLVPLRLAVKVDGPSGKVLITKQAELQHRHQELTLVRFVVDERGRIVEQDTIQESIRNN